MASVNKNGEVWTISNENGSVKMQISHGCLFISDLESDGKGSITELLSAARIVAKSEGFKDVYLTIDATNDRLHRLVAVYMKRYKAVPVSMIMRAPIEQN